MLGGFSEKFGTVFAAPGVAEKGYIDIRVAVASPGGHSSVPPSHTASRAPACFYPELLPEKLEHRHPSCPACRVRIQPSSRQTLQKYISPFLVSACLSHQVLDTVSYDLFKCLAAHSPKMPKDLRKALIQSTESDDALKAAESILRQDPTFKALVGTTQAIDLINGGVKA